MELLQDLDFRNKRVFLRTDFNVPVRDGEIIDNNRIKSALPTIKFLVESEAKIIIGSHFGRPEGVASSETSMTVIARELEKLLGFKVNLAPGVVDSETKKLASNLDKGQVLLLENLRWDKREEEDDLGFAKELAQMADIYINDAFAVSHRQNASVHKISQFLPSYAGLLLQAEITNLELLVRDPKKPFIVIIGGVKISDKAGVIEKLATQADAILVGGGVANTFLKAKGVDIGESVYDQDMVEACQEMLKKYGNKIVLPLDTVDETLPNGSLKILDIGPKTTKLFKDYIYKAKTVLWNGCLGLTEDPRYKNGSREIAISLRDLKEQVVIAGGDTAGFVVSEGLDSGISFISTGGGAALEFLAGNALPGIEVLKNKGDV